MVIVLWLPVALIQGNCIAVSNPLLEIYITRRILSGVDDLDDVIRPYLHQDQTDVVFEICCQ